MKLEKTAKKLRSLGFTERGIEYILTQISQVLCKCNDRKAITTAFELCFPAAQIQYFDGNQLRQFLCQIEDAIQSGYEILVLCDARTYSALRQRPRVRSKQRCSV